MLCMEYMDAILTVCQNAISSNYSDEPTEPAGLTATVYAGQAATSTTSSRSAGGWIGGPWYSANGETASLLLESLQEHEGGPRVPQAFRSGEVSARGVRGRKDKTMSPNWSGRRCSRLWRS